MRVRAVVAYDGTDYCGFQRQVNGPTVQAALEDGLAQISQETVSVLAAGRTDAGVHALGQVIAFDTRWRHTISDLHRALNAVLPADVAVLQLEEAAPGFHPRFDASSRWYRYTVYNAPVRSPLDRRRSLHVPFDLNPGAMERAAALLVGEFDFATFGRPPQGTNTVRRVLAAEWTVNPPWVIFDIEANAFLYRMVRSIVGTLLLVGQGKMDVREFESAFAACQRRLAGPTAPPHGLCLMEVKYYNRMGVSEPWKRLT